MKVIRRKRDEALTSMDSVRIDRRADGQFEWTGSVDAGRAAVFGFSRARFATAEEAEADAIVWAKGHGATEIVIIEADDA